MIDLSDEEFEYLYSVFYDRAYYGDDDIVYGDGAKAEMTRRVMQELDAEKRRREKR